MNPPLLGTEQVPPAEAEAAGEWPARIEGAVSGRSIRSLYQPIVDLARGVVAGYEALTRFDHPSPAARDVESWFRAAHSLGLGEQLEAAALAAAFANRSGLPRNCFMSVNVSPYLLASRSVRRVLDAQGDLSGVVIELTEQTAVDSYRDLDRWLTHYRARGALIAVDDAGSGYAGLRHLLDLRPSLIKLDRHFVAGIDSDPAKRVMVEMIGTFADRTDCWLLAEGLERPEELEVVVDLGVPLGQGYLLGRPAAPWSDLPESVAEMLCRRRVAREQGTVGARVESSAVAPSVEEGRRMLAEDEALEMVVVLDGRSRPLGIVDLDGSVFDAPAPVFRVGVDTPVRQALERAMVRPKATRFSPLVVTDENGKFLGVVHVERLISEILG